MDEKLKKQLARFRKWLSSNSIARVVRGFLPTFVDQDSSKLSVIIDDSMQPRTDGQTIWVSLIPDALQEHYSDEDWLILLRAAVAHEAQHVNSSNFKDIEQVMNWYGQYMADTFQFDPTIGKNIAKEALNIVEDGRIESIAIRRRPGMLVPFKFLNQIIREGCSIEQRAENPQEEYHDFWGNVLSYAKTGLYAPGIKVYENSDMELTFLAVRALIDDGVVAKTSADCRKVVEELLSESAAYLSNLIKNSPELEAELTTQETPTEYTSNKESEFNPAPNSSDSTAGQGEGKKGNPLRSNSPVPSQSGPQPDSAGTDQIEGSQNSKDGGKTQESPMGFSYAKDSADPLTPAQLDEVRTLISKELTAANSAEKAENTQPVSDGLDTKSIEEIRASYGGQTSPFEEKTLRINGQAEISDEMRAQSLTLRREILKILTERRKAQKGLRRGALDPGSLWKQGVGDGTIFSRRGNPQAGSCAFYLLIDNSGSMNEPATSDTRHSLSKSEVARSAAAIVEQAVMSLVPCKIALFQQSQGRVKHTVVRKFEETGSQNRSWNSLAEIGPGGCNADSINVRVAAEELSRRREQKKILLVVSDGQPSAYASRLSAKAEVKEAVKAARRKGVIVISIMVGDESFLKSSKADYIDMYEKDIIACRPQDIAATLAQLLRLIIRR